MVIHTGILCQHPLHIPAIKCHVHLLTLQLVCREIALLYQLLFQIVCRQLDVPEIVKHLTFHTSPIALLHAHPVLKRVRNQGLWCNRDDGVVEIAHLYRGQRDLFHHTIDGRIGHSDPISLAHHVVTRQLNAGHQTRNGVFEHQHQHGRGGT